MKKGFTGLRSHKSWETLTWTTTGQGYKHLKHLHTNISIPASVSEFFIDIKSFRLHYDPGVDSASNKNEYQEHVLGVKTAGA